MLRKSFLFILIFSLVSVLLSVLLVTFPEKCIPQGPPGSFVMCAYQAGSRGFPFPVFYLSYHNDLELLELAKTPMQIFGFVADLIVYFLLFSAIYLSYSKLFKKAKKQRIP